MRVKKVHIVGGGLAGLVTGLHLLKCGIKVTIFEKNSYPKHKVCGEYISNEVLPYLKSLDIYPMKYGATSLTKLECSSAKGDILKTELPLGGFGISRYALDNILYNAFLDRGGEVLLEQVEKIIY
ncbi:MAG: NAD(P)-binding protein, partial [Leeuwenhoekiella sp.]